MLYALQGKRDRAEETIDNMKQNRSEEGLISYSGFIKYMLGDGEGYFRCMFAALEEHSTYFSARVLETFPRKSGARYLEHIVKNGLETADHY